MDLKQISKKKIPLAWEFRAKLDLWLVKFGQNTSLFEGSWFQYDPCKQQDINLQPIDKYCAKPLPGLTIDTWEQIPLKCMPTFN